GTLSTTPNRPLRTTGPYMLPPLIIRRAFWTAEALTLVGVSAAAVLLSRAEEWQPITLVVMLLALALVAERLGFEIRRQHLSASLVVLVLTMCLLGPAPAVAFGLLVTIPNSVGRRLSLKLWLNNLAAFAAFPLVGGLIVFAVFMVTTVLNLAVIATEGRVSKGLLLARQTRALFLPMQPGQMVLGALTAILAVAYTNLG